MKEIISINKISQKEQKVQVYEQKEQMQEVKGWFWRSKGFRFIQTVYNIILTEENKIKYIKDGAILRIEDIKDSSLKQQIFQNLEQIQNLTWIGDYGNYGQKIGRWLPNWNGEAILDVGGQYNNDGKKEGIWKNIKNNFWSKAQVYESGQYVNGQKIGIQKLISQNLEIGGGEYNEQGYKNGNWIEVSDEYFKYFQVTYSGEYKNSKKVNRWDIWLKEVDLYGNPKDNIKIGGGSYEEGEDEKKIGNWIDIFDNCNVISQVTFNGEYKNGYRIGRWNIWFKEVDRELNTEQNIKIGGGLYEDGCNGNKIGTWIDISESFSLISQVTYNGEYKNSKRVGGWDIWYKEVTLCGNVGESQLIGGGSYEEGCNGNKIGKWIDISDNFNLISQVTYSGEYKYGKKIGRWDIWLKAVDGYLNAKKNFKIGGGLYDKEGDGMKIGKWIELDDGFDNDKQITYHGEYKNGKKVGVWDIFHRRHQNYPFSQIGGGLYNKGEDGIKIGKWIELDDGFDNDKQVTYHGEYKNGEKIGRWDTFYRKYKSDPFLYIGGGLYKGTCIKIGMWIELDNEFKVSKLVTYHGEYENGKKIGVWDTFHKRSENDPFLQIGGGLYDKGGDCIKIGKWIELDEGFDNDKQVTYHGEYKNCKKIDRWETFVQGQLISSSNYDLSGTEIYKSQGDILNLGVFVNCKKVGKWDILFQNDNVYFEWMQKTLYKDGGGSYDEEGGEIKIGKWIELQEGFSKDSQILYQGEYQNGKKLGRWDIMYRHNTSNPFSQIAQLKFQWVSGGGSYELEQNAIKIGKWIDLDEEFDYWNQVIYIGEYNNGIKVGTWIEMKRDSNTMEKGFYKVKEIDYNN